MYLKISDYLLSRSIPFTHFSTQVPIGDLFTILIKILGPEDCRCRSRKRRGHVSDEQIRLTEPTTRSTVNFLTHERRKVPPVSPVDPGSSQRGSKAGLLLELVDWFFYDILYLLGGRLLMKPLTPDLD